MNVFATNKISKLNLFGLKNIFILCYLQFVTCFYQFVIIIIFLSNNFAVNHYLYALKQNYFRGVSDDVIISQ